jgi:hypothetical protein
MDFTPQPSTPETRLKSFHVSLAVLAGFGCLGAYWGFTNGWPPPPMLLLTGIAGIMLVASAIPAAYVRTPTTHTILFLGNSIASIWGIILEVILFRRMGLNVGLIYPFGLIIFGIVANTWYLLKPQTKELFGIAKPLVSSHSQDQAPTAPESK